MIETIKGWVKQLLTGKDNETLDIGRIMGGGSFLFGHFMEGWRVFVQGKDFDMQAYAIGVTALLAGLGVMLGLKAATEPDKKEGG